MPLFFLKHSLNPFQAQSRSVYDGDGGSRTHDLLNAISNPNIF